MHDLACHALQRRQHRIQRQSAPASAGSFPVPSDDARHGSGGAGIHADARGGKLLLGVQRAASGVTSKTLQLLSDKTGQKHKRRIFSTIDHFFGGKLRAILVGAAPLSPDTFRLFEGFGYAVYCGYGLTETAPISLMHDDFYRCADDTGFPVCGVEARIDSPDENGIGELCLRGPNVMLGYHNNPEATSEVLRDGWLYTGDLAQMTKSGAYRITTDSVGEVDGWIFLEDGSELTYQITDAGNEQCYTFINGEYTGALISMKDITGKNSLNTFAQKFKELAGIS